MADYDAIVDSTVPENPYSSPPTFRTLQAALDAPYPTSRRHFLIRNPPSPPAEPPVD